MAEPTYPVVYWRDVDTNSTIPAYDTLEKLIAEKPDQVVQIENNQAGDKLKSSVISITSGGAGNIIDEPLFNPQGVKTIEKQMAGAISEHTSIKLKIHESEYPILTKLRSFYRKPNKEKEYHTYGIIGFWFPPTETTSPPTLVSDNFYKISPTNVLGSTMKPPITRWGIDEEGSEYMTIEIDLSLGGKDLK